MSRCVPSWDLEDINPNHEPFKFDYEVAELKWENGQVAMHELGHRRLPTKSLPTTSWDKPRATETLEAIVNQATHQPYLKPQVTPNVDDLVPWLNHHTTKTNTTTALNASAILTCDALVPSSSKSHRVLNNVRDAGCSTRVGSCSELHDPTTAFINRGMAAPSDLSLSISGTIGTYDTCDDNLGDQRFTSLLMGSPENISSGRDCYKSTSPDDSGCHCKTQRETNEVKEKRRGKAKSSIISNKRRRTAAIHNQSERKRRDKINQRMTTLQKMVPNSNKTDKSSMLDEVIEYVKQLQAQVHMMNIMNIPPMMMPLVMQQQQQQQMQMSMMNSMGMGIGMGMGGIDMMNTMGFLGTHMLPMGMHMPSWNGQAADRAVNPSTMATDPMAAFLSNRTQQMNMDAYNRMAALYQHMQNKQGGSLPKN